jgi:cation:H+ antiporter
MPTIFLLILAGLVLLYIGGEALVRGASSLAARLGVSPLIIGLTVVAYGTGMPELLTSLKAALRDSGGIAVGNAIGANCFNIGCALGIAALLCPLQAESHVVRFDLRVLALVALTPLWFLADGVVTRLEAGMLLALMVIYTAVLIRKAKKVEDPAAPQVKKSSADLLFLAAGLVALFFGSRWLIEGTVQLARHFGVNETLLGLSVVSVGSSLPELATCVVAATRKQSGLVLGNVIGSCIFNILAGIGVAGLVNPLTAPAMGIVDILVMITFSLILLPMMRSGFSLSRWEGMSLIVSYAIYQLWLWK